MEADLSLKIRKQIEYYFGDINLAKDKFLRDLNGKEDGWVPIEKLLTFNRLKALTEKPTDVAAAFEDNQSELIQLNEAKDKLRRSVPLPEMDEKSKTDLNLRTIHFRGFPRENTTLDELIEFSSQYGEIEHVNMRRMPDKTFKGCCMTIYKDIESANKALASKEKFKGEVEIIQRENKMAYFKRKNAGRSFKKDSKAEKPEEGEPENKEEVKKPVEKPEETYESGCILKLIDLPENLKYREIKEELFKHAKVQYVDIDAGSKTGAIRFASKEETEKALKVFALDNQSNGDAKKNGNAENGNTENGTEKSDENQEVVKNGEDATVEESKDEAPTEESKDEAPTEESKDEAMAVESKDDAKTEESKAEANTEEEPANADDKASEVTNGAEKASDEVVYRKLKIKDDLILTFTILTGEEEKEYWQKVRKFSAQKQNQNKGNRFNKGRSGGRFNNNYKNNHFNKNNRFNKNKRGASDESNNAKRAKVDN